MPETEVPTHEFIPLLIRLYFYVRYIHAKNRKTWRYRPFLFQIQTCPLGYSIWNPQGGGLEKISDAPPPTHFFFRERPPTHTFLFFVSSPPPWGSGLYVCPFSSEGETDTQNDDGKTITPRVLPHPSLVRCVKMKDYKWNSPYRLQAREIYNRFGGIHRRGPMFRKLMDFLKPPTGLYNHTMWHISAD